jgi:hypothetical protein
LQFSFIFISITQNVAFSISTKKAKPGAENSDEEGDNKTKAAYRLDLDKKITIMQVVRDDVDHTYRQAVGGHKFVDMDSRVIVKFRAVGQYTFVAFNTETSNYSPPLRVQVLEEQPISLLINDDGFLPKIIRVEEGSTLKWTWNKLAYPHSIYEAEYCDEHLSLFRTSKKFDYLNLFFFNKI